MKAPPPQRNVKAMTAATVAGVLRPIARRGRIIVSALAIAKERGIVVDEVTRSGGGDYESLITVSVTTRDGERIARGIRCFTTAGRASSPSMASAWRRSSRRG